MALRILFIGEIVGKAGIFCVKSLLPSLRKELHVDFVIANGDGATGGFGLGKNHSIYLRKLGIDVLTSGDQIYFKKDMVQHIERASYILRPANYPQVDPGRGWRYYSVEIEGPDQAVAGSSRQSETQGMAETEVAAPDNATVPENAESADTGQSAETAASSGDSPQNRPRRREPKPGSRTIAVVNLMGQSGFTRTHLSNPFTYLPEIVSRIHRETKTVIVDFHAVTTAEKSSMFHHADGKVSAVIGTGTRAITADAEVMPRGTAVISDAGRTGSLNSVAGLDPKIELQKFLNQIPERSRDAWDGLELQGVLIEIDDEGRATRIDTIRRACTEVPDRDREGDSNRN